MAALNPGGVGAILDFNNNNDLKFYQNAVKGVDESEKYDLSPGKLKSFLDNVKAKVIMFGWMDIVTVPPLAAVAPVGPARSLLDNYGTVTLNECTMHALGYMAAAPLGRPAQNATMLYHFLMASLTPEARSKVNVDPMAYTIGGHEDGLCFLRTIITKAQLDTIGTVETLRASIGKFETKIVELTGNIIDFHQHVNTITNALDSYGQAYPELILNLFKAYNAVEDKEFTTYIMVTRFGYNANPAAYNARTLMDGVENIYKLRVESGTWKPSLVSPLNEIQALQAQVQALSAQINKNDTPTSEGNSSSRNAKRQAKKEKDAWKAVPPGANEVKTKSFENRTYHWCPNHKMWTMHKPEDCQGINYRPGTGNNASQLQANASTTAPAQNEDPIVRVNEAMSTIVRYGDNNLS
jgi:hypothetical protein